jgi:hypothetical protein
MSRDFEMIPRISFVALLNRHRNQGDFTMTVFTYSETRQRLAAVLDSAKRKGEAPIQWGDGSLFRLVPVVPAKSPLDIEGVDGGVSSHEILAAIRERRLAAMEAEDFFADRVKRADFDKFRALLHRPRGEAPRPGDEIEE